MRHRAGLVLGVLLLLGVAGRAEAQGGLQGRQWTCGLTALGATLTQCQAAPTTPLRLYLTDILVQTTTATSGTWSIQTGTGANCGSSTAALVPASGTGDRFNAPILSSALASITFVSPLAAPVANAICVIGVGTNTITIQLSGIIAP